MDMLLMILSFLAINTCEITANQTQVITTKTGKVQGDIQPSSIPGKMVQRFLNIPYAEPPVGKLRFSKPQPKKPWQGILKNSTKKIACLQFSTPGITLTEDCLILDICTPYPQPTNATVMVWIHGGGFLAGSSAEYPGHNIVAVGDVILVTINYRLSVLGFLSTADHRIKGNFGLFDQRLAMKWVKDNIASFGGNPQSITIFGESAGAVSVSAHTLSKQSWPYFDRAIIQSGSMIMPWAIIPKPLVKQSLYSFLNSVNCSDNENLLECLQTNVTVKDLEKFYNSQSFFSKGVWHSKFGPCVDEEFLTDEPKKLWNNGAVKNNDIILGNTKDESFLFDQTLLQQSREISFFTKTFETLLKNHFKNSSEAVYKQALELYQAKCTPSFIEAFKPIVAFNSDIWFICPTINEVNSRSKMFKSANVYLYQYSYSSPIRREPIPIYAQGTFGFAAHGLDVVPTFGESLRNPRCSSEDKILSLRIILYFTNFAKTGDPNLGITKLPIVLDKIDSLPKWPKFTNSSREYLDMESLSRMMVEKRLREMHCDFLNDPEAFTEQSTSITVKHIALFGVALLVVVSLQRIF